MISDRVVVDASVTIELLLGTTAGQKVQAWITERKVALHGPGLLYLETLQVLRRYLRTRSVTEEQAREAVGKLTRLRIIGHGPSRHLDRIWSWRNNLSAYDAAYVVLAEELGATLLTADGRLARAAGRRIPVEQFAPSVRT